jgi:hypothetical protein
MPNYLRSEKIGTCHYQFKKYQKVIDLFLKSLQQTIYIKDY